MIKIDGKALAQKVKDEVKEKLQNPKYEKCNKPHLVVIQVGNNDASNVYIRNKKKACEEVGFEFSLYKFDYDVVEDTLISTIRKLNLTGSVTGILVQLPLPDHIDTAKIIDCIDPMKDVDGFTTTQAGKLQLGIKENRLEPCTAKGIVRLLESVTDLEGKLVTVVGRSNIVGKPVAQLLQEKNATVTLCHSKTDRHYIQDYTSTSDITVLAVGKAEYFDSTFFPDYMNDYIIIDAGINRNSDGKLCGDLDVKDLEKHSVRNNNTYYTPVPGGVGPMTIAELIDNIYLAYEMQYCPYDF